MLSNLRQYITNEKEMTKDGERLKIICERCHDRKYVIEFLESLDVEGLNNEEVSLFTQLIDNWHLIDYSNDETGAMLCMIVKCFSKTVDIKIERYVSVELLTDLYLSNCISETDAEIIEFLESCEFGETNEFLEAITDPNLSEKERDRVLDEYFKSWDDHYTYIVKFETDETDESYFDLCWLMDELFKCVKVNEYNWFSSVSGYDCEGTMEEFMDLSNVDLDILIQEIKNMEKRNDVDSFNHIFYNLSEDGCNIPIIDKLLNIKRTNQEVLM